MDISEIMRGHTDTVILKQLLYCDCYGYQITRNILKDSDDIVDLTDATIYTAFRRLVKAGLITSYWGDSEQGARRRYYKITEHGRKYYKKKKQDWMITKKILENLIIGGNDND